MTVPLLFLQQVTKAFQLPSGERLDILRGIDFTINPGDVTAVVGRSGSGKSTFLNVLGLLDQPTTGTYLCNGKAISSLGDRQLSALRGSFFGFIFQQFFLLDRRTAMQNVAEPLLQTSGQAFTRRDARTTELLEQVGLGDRLNAMPHVLSGGEQQRVAIARALVRKPRIILADEPTGSLDVETGKHILDILLQRVRADNVALIIVTHDPEIARMADKVLRLDSGVLVPEP